MNLDAKYPNMMSSAILRDLGMQAPESPAPVAGQTQKP